MGILKQWWSNITNYFKTLDEEPTQTPVAKPKAKRKKTVKNTKTETNVKASSAIKMITESINTEKDSGKKKYKSRLARELNNAIEVKNKEAIAKSISRIVKYLDK